MLLPTNPSDANVSYATMIEHAVHALIREQITCLVTVPFTLRALLKRLEREPKPPELTLRHCLIGGDVIPEDTYERFRSCCGFVVCELYGTTEAHALALTPLDGGAGKGRYKPYGSTKFRILDAGGTPLPPGQPGEIAIQSPALMLGYVNDSALTAEVLANGWLRTGDLGYLDGDGYLRFVGRLKHIICYDGDNIGPQEVEAALLGHPRVVEACVVGIPSKTNSEKPAAYVVIGRDGEAVGYSELAAFLADRIAEHKIPVAMRFLQALPRTANRKLDRKSLIARATTDFMEAIAAEEDV